MNKHIFELAKQADLIQWDTLSSGVRTPDHKSVVKAKKFAKLIIRECVAEIHVADVGNLHAKAYYLDKVAEHIEKHFGIN